MSNSLKSTVHASGPLPVDFLANFHFDVMTPAMHAKRARAIARASLAAMHADQLAIADLGRAYARVYGGSPKHGIKQIDRLVGNAKFRTDDVFSRTVPWLVGDRDHIVVSLDWTEYAKDGHARAAVNLITGHGRATPLVWKTYERGTFETTATPSRTKS